VLGLERLELLSPEERVDGSVRKYLGGATSTRKGRRRGKNEQGRWRIGSRFHRVLQRGNERNPRSGIGRRLCPNSERGSVSDHESKGSDL
jgi:hypothetical protein